MTRLGVLFPVAVIVPAITPLVGKPRSIHLGRGFLQLMSNFRGFEGHFETPAVLWNCP